MILAIDTSAGQCAVALVGDDRTIHTTEAMQRGHAEALFRMIDQVLSDAGADWSQVDRIAVCTGPGSFTGLRVGIAAARGLSLGLDVPAIGISRFEALAAETALPATITLPGRRGQIYRQRFGPGPVADGDPWIDQGEAEDRLADPVVIARLAATRDNAERPAPLYLRGADADLPRDPPPVILDA